MTPLHIACMNKDFEMVQILVEIGADMGAQDKVSLYTVHNIQCILYLFETETYQRYELYLFTMHVYVCV